MRSRRFGRRGGPPSGEELPDRHVVRDGAGVGPVVALVVPVLAHVFDWVDLVLGDMHFNGGSVAHLHTHFVALGPEPLKTVRFRVSARAED